MRVIPFVTPPLGHAGYLVVRGAEAAAVDPQRDCADYARGAADAGARIRLVLLTHLPEDHVSGALELARLTGAEVALSPRAGAAFPHRTLRDGETLALGDATLTALHTPGHGPDAACYVFRAPGGAQQAFTGGTLVVGDTARVDHLGDGEARAAELFESLARLCAALPPEAVLWAGHRAGSFAVRAPSEEIRSTLAAEIAANPALRCADALALARHILAGQHEVPPHFARLHEANRLGPPPSPAPPRALAPAEFAAAVRSGAAALDVRPVPNYNGGHVPGILHVGLEGQLEWWAASLLPGDARLALVAPEDRLEEALARLARVGLDHFAGVLAGGMDAWRAAGLPVRTAEPLEPGQALSRVREDARLQFVDVRRAWEWETSHAPGAAHIPLHELSRRAGELDPSRPVAVVCRGGYRSSIAGSLLEARGFAGLVNVTGGMLAWEAQRVELAPPGQPG